MLYLVLCGVLVGVLFRLNEIGVPGIFLEHAIEFALDLVGFKVKVFKIPGCRDQFPHTFGCDHIEGHVILVSCGNNGLFDVVDGRRTVYYFSCAVFSITIRFAEDGIASCGSLEVNWPRC